MRRTRKWSFVAQEAGRLAALGLSPTDIATRLGVNRSSVTRWMANGKLVSTRRQVDRAPSTAKTVVRQSRTPAEWAKEIRGTYDLDATDDQLVTVAESALSLSLDETAPPQIRLQAAGRFQGIVKQLALVARSAEKIAAIPEPEKQRFRVVHRSPTDPRMALK